MRLHVDQARWDIGKATTVNSNSPQSPGGNGRTPTAPAATAPYGRGEAVLVVEDESYVREVTVARLISLGYSVLEASTGAAAMEVLSGHPEIEVLFSDLALPGKLSGLDLAKRVHQLRPDVHVILTSGRSTDLRSRCGEDLDLQVLPKPYRQSELARIFRDTLETRMPRAATGNVNESA
jgi:CheY-like chemotaxis protein